MAPRIAQILPEILRPYSIVAAIGLLALAIALIWCFSGVPGHLFGLYVRAGTRLLAFRAEIRPRGKEMAEWRFIARGLMFTPHRACGQDIHLQPAVALANRVRCLRVIRSRVPGSGPDLGDVSP